MGSSSRFQKFEMEAVNRAQIKGAEYNPRIISAEAKKRLKKMLEKHGLVQPLVWNKRTGNLVAGHQRLAVLDTLENVKNYDLLVAVIDVPLREEKILNVQLNNPSMQGEWDIDKLSEIVGEDSINPEELGFSESDAELLFGDESQFADIMQDVEGVTDAKDALKEIKEHRAESAKKMAEENSANFYFTVVCESEEQKKAILKTIGVPDWETFVCGSPLAGKLGV